MNFDFILIISQSINKKKSTLLSYYIMYFTGAEFNKESNANENGKNQKQFYKLINETGNHRGYTFKNGLNVDSNLFTNDACAAGGFHFTDSENIGRWVNYSDEIGVMVFAVPMTIPDDAKVIIFTDEKKYKTDKFILDLDHKIYIWSNPELCMAAV